MIWRAAFAEKLRFLPPEPMATSIIGHAASICLILAWVKSHNASSQPTNLMIPILPKGEQSMWRRYKTWYPMARLQMGIECYFPRTYFQQLYDWRSNWSKEGKAYVDNQSAEAMAEQKGAKCSRCKASPFRNVISFAETWFIHDEESRVWAGLMCSGQNRYGFPPKHAHAWPDFCYRVVKNALIVLEQIGVLPYVRLDSWESITFEARFHIQFVLRGV